MRVKSRYTRLARTSRSRSLKLQLRMCFRVNCRSTTSAGIPRQPRRRLLGWRCANASYDLLDFFVRQCLIGVLHPVFAKIADLFRDQPVAETELPAPHLNHAAFSAALTQPVVSAADLD